MAGLRSYWRWLGQRLRLSQPGRAFFTAALLLGGSAIVFGRAQGDREGGAPLVVLALVLAGWSPSMQSVGESSRLFAVSSWAAGPRVIPELTVIVAAVAASDGWQGLGRRRLTRFRMSTRGSLAFQRCVAVADRDRRA